MNALTKWNPFREMENLQHRLFSLWNPLSSQRTGYGEETMTLSEWCPLVDIREDKQEYLIKAELPEVKKEDIHVAVENGVLSIRGERKFEKEVNDQRYHRVERAYGTFERTFSLPDDADAAKVKAEFKEGLLTVHLGKSEAAKPKQIEVKVS